ncbi:MAG: DUF4855 domain-containing protein [Promethearchaeota archaeon]
MKRQIRSDKWKHFALIVVFVYAMSGTFVIGCYKAYSHEHEHYLSIGERTGGIHDMVLIYSDLFGGNQERDFQQDDFMPLLVHYQMNSTLPDFGNPSDWFGFDGFLFMALGRNTTGRAFYPGFGSGGPSNKSDWEWLINKWFVAGHDFDALEQAIINATNILGIDGYPYHNDLVDNETVMKVVVCCPQAPVDQHGWGVLSQIPDGLQGVPGSLLDFQYQNDRLLARCWFIDEFLEKWEENKDRFPHLQFTGFYWLDESIQEYEINECKTWNKRIHEAGYKSFWIPYNMAHSLDIWAELGFDAVSLQPNLFFDWRKLIAGQGTTIEQDPFRVERTAAMAKALNAGVEYEIDDTILYNDTSREFLSTHFFKYQDTGARTGFMDEYMTYYQCVQTIRHLEESTNPIDNERYEQLWQFVRGTYVP